MAGRRDHHHAAAGFLVAAVVLLGAHAVAGAGDGWQTGRASAYSSVDSPGRMACTGTRVPGDRLLVAHKSLPCGSRLRVCNAGVCVTVRVADRGPYIPGRVLDLTPGVIKAFGVPSPRVWGVRTVSWKRL